MPVHRRPTSLHCSCLYHFFSLARCWAITADTVAADANKRRRRARATKPASVVDGSSRESAAGSGKGGGPVLDG